MTSTVVCRRTFIHFCAALTIAASSRAYGGPGGPDGHVKSVLQRMARLLFPHEQLDDTVYEAATQTLYLAPTESSMTRQLQEGAGELDALAGGDWLNADPERQIAAMKAIEHSEFFAAMRDRIRLRLYRNPVVWDLIGYPGPSAPVGYIDRGFDEIDWLPES